MSLPEYIKEFSKIDFISINSNFDELEVSISNENLIIDF